MIAIESDRMRVEVDPAFGARVTALWDKRAGREWLVTGPREGDRSEAATYGAREARGWDECFPTVAPCEHPRWGRLRDHGLLWGRPWRVVAHGPTLRASYREERFAFTRVLDVHGPTLTVAYELEGEGDLPWMWSQHCLLAARPGERLALEGFCGFRTEGRPLDWPALDGRDLSVVGAPEDGFALKAYADARGAARAVLEGAEGGIAFAWDAGQVGALGLWLDWGGWPADPALGAPVHQLAIEPTTAPSDDLLGAEAAGAARVLRPDLLASWRMTISLTDPS
jgi:hypothetical protein